MKDFIKRHACTFSRFFLVHSERLVCVLRADYFKRAFERLIIVLYLLRRFNRFICVPSAFIDVHWYMICSNYNIKISYLLII